MSSPVKIKSFAADQDANANPSTDLIVPKLELDGLNTVLTLDTPFKE